MAGKAEQGVEGLGVGQIGAGMGIHSNNTRASNKGAGLCTLSVVSHRSNGALTEPPPGPALLAPMGTGKGTPQALRVRLHKAHCTAPGAVIGDWARSQVGSRPKIARNWGHSLAYVPATTGQFFAQSDFGEAADHDHGYQVTVTGTGHRDQAPAKSGASQEAFDRTHQAHDEVAILPSAPDGAIARKRDSEISAKTQRLVAKCMALGTYMTVYRLGGKSRPMPEGPGRCLGPEKMIE